MDHNDKNNDSAKEPENKEENKEALEEGQEEALELSPEEKLLSELASSKDRFLRLAAEFDNFKKISARERLNSLKFANEGLIMALLPSIDGLEQALKAGKSADNNAQELLVGVEMVLKQVIDALGKFGVEFFNSEGLPFDPNRHEALCEQHSSDQAPGTVIQEYQKGCLLHGRLLRPARVVVAKASE
jgi:molecular chaperone GrpE